MPIDPAVLKFLQQAGAPPATDDIAVIRAHADAAAAHLWRHAALPIPDVHEERRVVTVADAPDVTVRLFRRPGPVTARPALITFFGGAFRQGCNDYDINRWMHAYRAVRADVVVVAVDYALAPEHPFPIQLRQGLAVIDDLSAHADELGIDGARLAVGGQSSGANIAAAVTQLNLDRAGPPVQLQLLEVPCLDLTGSHLDAALLQELGLEADHLSGREELVHTYLGRLDLARDPRASPLMRPDLTGLPRTVILTAEYDPLRGDARAYHARLRDAGVDSTLLMAHGATHDSSGLVGALGAARTWHDIICGVLVALHAEPD